jgi:hypothetical protein
VNPVEAVAARDISRGRQFLAVRDEFDGHPRQDPTGLIDHTADDTAAVLACSRGGRKTGKQQEREKTPEPTFH